jgi:ABC-type spermidine/putrescine transport system permease subunit II
VKTWLGGGTRRTDWPRATPRLLGLFTSGLGAQLTWTLPFGLLIMFAVFNRFNPAYEEAARDLGATPVADASATWCCR